MKTADRVNRAISLSDKPLPFIKVNVLRSTAIRFARPKERGGSLWVGAVEIIPRKQELKT